MKKVYIAGPLFTPGQRNYLEEIGEFIKSFGFNIYLPHKDGGLFIRGINKSKDFFDKDLEALNNCSILVAILNGNDIDSGTSWEIGYAYSKGIPIIGILDDTRKPEVYLLNPMILNSTIRIVKSTEELKEELKKLE